MNQTELVDGAVRDGSRYASTTPEQNGPGCLVCGTSLADARARFCSPAHKQLAYRLRRRATRASDEPDLRRQLQRQRRLTAHTIYECPSCGERFVGERRCPSCRLFCRSLGLGGHCPECDQPILLSDLLE
jgi:ribosomal protein L32